MNKKTSDGDKPIEGSEAATSPLAAPAPLTAIVPPAPAPPAAAAEKRTPAEWAAKYQHTKSRNPKLPQTTDWLHPSYAVADKLYGWSEHAYNFQAPEDRFEITDADYRAAVRSAPNYPVSELVEAAITPTAAPRLEGFKPKKSGKAKPADKAKEST